MIVRLVKDSAVHTSEEEGEGEGDGEGVRDGDREGEEIIGDRHYLIGYPQTRARQLDRINLTVFFNICLPRYFKSIKVSSKILEIFLRLSTRSVGSS